MDLLDRRRKMMGIDTEEPMPIPDAAVAMKDIVTTDIVPGNPDSLRIETRYKVIGAGSAAFQIGSRSTTYANAYDIVGVSYPTSSDSGNTMLGRKATGNVLPYNLFTDYTLIFDKDGAILNGQPLSWTRTGTPTTPVYPIWIGKLNQAGSATATASNNDTLVAINYFKIYTDGVLTTCLIPYRESATDFGLVDAVTNTKYNYYGKRLATYFEPYDWSSIQPLGSEYAEWDSHMDDYLYSNIYPTTGMKTEAKFMPYDLAADNYKGHLFGVRTASNSDNGSYIFNLADTASTSEDGRANWKSNGKKFTRNTTLPVLTKNETHIIKGDDLGITVDGVRYNFADYSYETFTATYPSTFLGLGRLRIADGSAPGSSSSIKGRLYYLKVWDANDNLVHHLIPYPTPQYPAKAIMYDLVTGEVGPSATIASVGRVNLTPGINYFDNDVVPYIKSGAPIIQNNILSLDGSENRNFIYTREFFAPGSSEWSIETKINLHSPYISNADFITAVTSDGSRKYQITVQGVKSGSVLQFRVFASSNGTSWNLINDKTGVQMGVTEEWRYIKLEKSGNTLTLYQRAIGGSWATIGGQSFSYTGIESKIAFGGGFANRCVNADFDLSATKIYINNQRWWDALGDNSTLPTGCTAYDWLDSDGTQYIDTGIGNGLTTEQVEIESTAAFLSGAAQYSWTIFATTTNGNYVGVQYSSSTKIGVFSGDSSTTEGNNPTYRKFIRLSFPDIKVASPSTTTVSRALAATTYSSNFLLLAKTTGITKGAIQRTKIWVDGILVRDYQPCTDPNGVAAAYDYVTGTFNYGSNASGNAFTVRND